MRDFSRRVNYICEKDCSIPYENYIFFGLGAFQSHWKRRHGRYLSPEEVATFQVR